MYEVPAACAAAVVTKREVLTLDSKNPPAPPPSPYAPPPTTKGGERREDGGGEKNFSTILGKATSLFCMCTVLSPRSCLRGTPGSRVGGPVSHDWTFPAFKFGRGLLVLVLVEAKSTARQQNFFRSPMPLPNFRDRLWSPGPCKGEVNGAPAKLFSVPGASVKILLSCAQSLRSPVPLSKFCSPVRSLFGPRCLCQNFCSCARGLLVLVRLEEKSTARQQNVFRSPMPLSNFRDRRRRPGPGACGGEVSSAPAKFCSVSANRDAPIFYGKRSAHPKKIFDHR